MSIARLLKFLPLVIVCVIQARGQQAEPAYNVGVTPYSSYDGGDIDHIGMYNGSLNFQIPLISYPQRGGKLRLGYMARYNSKYLTEKTICDQYDNCQSYLAHSAIDGIQTTGFAIADDQQITPFNLHYTLKFVGVSHGYYPLAVVTPDGGTHFGDELYGTTTQITLDGTAIMGLSPNSSDQTATRCCGLIDADGIAYNPASGILRQDPNGNQITESSDGSGTTIDTVGRAIAALPNPVTGGDTTGCTGTLPISAVSIWSVPGANSSSLTYKFCYAVVSVYIPAALCTGVVQDYQGAAQVLQSILLPNGKSWTFDYNARSSTDASNVNYGEVSKITFPTGGSISYGYTMLQTDDGNYVCSAAVTSRTVDANDGQGGHTWTYAFTEAVANTTLTTDPLGNQTNYTFGPNGEEVEADFNQKQPNGSQTLLKKVQTQYNSTTPLSVNETTPDGTVQIAVQPQTVTTTLDNGLVSQRTFAYCCSYTFFGIGGFDGVTADPTFRKNVAYGFQSDVKDYDFGQGSPGPLLREASTNFLWPSNSSYQSANLLHLPASVVTLDGGGNQVASVAYTYDEGSFLTSSSISTQHVGVSGPRGNLTTTTPWLNGGSSPVSHTNWYDSGVPYQSIDPKNGTTTYGYSGSYAGSLLTSVSNALGQTSSATYDSTLGLKSTATDANNQTTSWSYDNPGRTLNVTAPDHGQTTYCYSDTGGSICPATGPPFSVYAATLATPDPTITKIETFDGLGRPSRSMLQSDPLGSDIVDTVYDPMGRVASVTNPYRNPAASIDPPPGTTSYAYDALGRKTFQYQPDNNYLQWVYAGNVTTAYDEARNSWQRTTDALGRLTGVVEPGNLPTAYSYDALGNLWNVTQSGVSGETPRFRSFIYDSLSRLTSATNPETGTIGYSYDANGNLQTEAAPAPNSAPGSGQTVTTTYTYDALNRLITRQAPGINYGYMYDVSGTTFTSSNPIGRMTEASNNVNASEQYSYDAMGRVIWQQNTLPDLCCGNPSDPAVSISYDLAGNMTSLTYPDGRVVTQGVDAAGHLQNVSFDNWNGQHVGYPYASAFTYTAAGAQAEVTYGNGVYIHTPYNNRQQICQVWVSNPQQPLMDKHYGYANSDCGNAPGNNGNITQVWDERNNTRSQGFNYDPLNRLASFSNGDGSMQQSYSYDSFGNMSQSGTLNFQGNYNASANNQINLTGYIYDAAGNLAQIMVAGMTSNYTFDANNQIANFNNGAATYTYDGNGERVRKDAGGSWTEYVYFNGQPLAEKNSDGSWSDYIYANGRKIARADSYDVRIHFSGTNCSNCGATAWAYNIPVPAYTIQSGDKIAWRQYQTGSAAPRGGVGIRFTDGTYTNWVAVDQDDQMMNNDATQNAWHYRVVDLSQYVGETIAASWINEDTWSGAGDWQEYFSDIAFYRQDGTVQPIYNRQTNVSYSSFGQGVTNQTFEVNIMQNDAWEPMDTTTYYVGDHLGSTRLTASGGGWPMSSDTFYPFGQEQNPTGDPNHYKFTGKERDAESGLDDFGARYYASTMGRFMSPDSSGYSGLTNPQSWNLYAYTLNNPLRYVDPSGHTVECKTDAAGCLSAAQAAVGKDAAGQLTTKTTTTQNWFQKIFGLSTTTTTLQITGSESDFRAASGNASKLADLIDSKTNFGVSISQNAEMEHPGTINGIINDSGFNLYGGAQTFTPSQGLIPQVFLDPRSAMVPGARMDEDRDHIPPANMGEKFAHELLGHEWGEVFGGHPAGTAANKRDAVNSENEVRRTDPSRGQKTEHH